MRIDNVLSEEVVKEVIELEKMQIGTEEYERAVDGIARLSDRVIDIQKIEAEEACKMAEIAVSEQKAEDEKKDRKIKNGIAIGTALTGTLVTIWGTLRSFKFEENGSVTTILGREHVRNLMKSATRIFK